MSKRTTLPWYILLLIILLCAVIFLSTCEGFATNASGFKNDIKNNENALVLFFSNNCGYCKELKPEWESAVSQLDSKYIASIDCSPSAGGTVDEEVTKIMKEYNITGFPTILYFNNGLVQETYDGERTAKAMVEYVKEKNEIENKKSIYKTQNNYSIF
jgi:thiol-disulfide isomerase/thioredoxin